MATFNSHPTRPYGNDAASDRGDRAAEERFTRKNPAMLAVFDPGFNNYFNNCIFAQLDNLNKNQYNNKKYSAQIVSTHQEQEIENELLSIRSRQDAEKFADRFSNTKNKQQTLQAINSIKNNNKLLSKEQLDLLKSVEDTLKIMIKTETEYKNNPKGNSNNINDETRIRRVILENIEKRDFDMQKLLSGINNFEKAYDIVVDLNSNSYGYKQNLQDLKQTLQSMQHDDNNNSKTQQKKSSPLKSCCAKFIKLLANCCGSSRNMDVRG